MVAQVPSGDQVVEVAREARPDVALLDIEMPGMDGLAAAAALREAMPACKVLILTTFGRPGYLRRAMEAGASGFLVKDGPAEELADVIRRAVRGDRVVDPGLAATALSAGPNPLSQRERDVLAASGGGATVAEVAAALFLSRTPSATTSPPPSRRPAPATASKPPASPTRTGGCRGGGASPPGRAEPRLAANAAPPQTIPSPGSRPSGPFRTDPGPDCVVLDLTLPGVHGLEVLRRLRTWSKVPVVVLTATDAERDKAAAFELGADDHVTKPFGTAELRARIKVALRHGEQAKATPAAATSRTGRSARRDPHRVTGELHHVDLASVDHTRLVGLVKRLPLWARHVRLPPQPLPPGP